MKEFRADLHIHTLLSPCASLEMSPVAIVEAVLAKGIEIVAITDHNHTAHGMLIRELAAEKGIYVLPGAEITSSEEIHCLAYFDRESDLVKIQEYIDTCISRTANEPRIMGFQPVVDRNEMIVKEIEHSLYGSLSTGIEDICSMVHQTGGLFVPAHIDRPYNSLFSQIGFIPDGLLPDAYEISFRSDPEILMDQYPELRNHTLLKSSDAHYPDNIGRGGIKLRMKEISFDEIRMAFARTDGREAILL
jgi:PHP family Zn ribbon phosphoesterase